MRTASSCGRTSPSAVLGLGSEGEEGVERDDDSERIRQRARKQEGTDGRAQRSTLLGRGTYALRHPDGGDPFRASVPSCLRAACQLVDAMGEPTPMSAMDSVGMMATREEQPACPRSSWGMSCRR